MRLCFLIILLPLFISCISTSDQPAAAKKAEDLVVKAMCSKDIALLGEDGSHGSGRTIDFKVKLVQRLIDECQFDSFVIEAGTYDFLKIQERLRSGQRIETSTVAAAVGFMWHQEEMAPLIPFLTEKMNARTLRVGGIDDQIGRGTYAQAAMGSELIAYLKGPRQAECQAAWERHRLWRYDQKDPFSLNHASFIQSCWKDIGVSMAQLREAGHSVLAEHLAMTQNLERYFSRQVKGMQSGLSAQEKDRNGMNHRDHSMFLNLEDFLNQPSAPRKVIVWTASVHAAKDLQTLGSRYGDRIPMGSYVHKKYGQRSFVLGFSALAGRFTLGSTSQVHVIPEAPKDALEYRAFQEETADAVYLDPRTLQGLGAVAAHPFNFQTWTTGTWDGAFDGMVVFREEVMARALPSEK